MQSQITLSPGHKIRWSSCDDFTDTLAAGLVNGSYATDGKSLRTAVDANSKLSLANGLLNFITGGAAAGNPGFWLPIAARAAGQILVADVTPADTAADHASIGFDANQAGTITDAIQFANTGILNVVRNAATAIAVGAFTAVNYKVALVMRATGMFWFINGGAFTYWTLLWPGFLGSAAAYPGIGALGTASVFTSSFLRHPQNLWLPGPLASDSFNRADGAVGNTDGAGHAEANGGGGLPWTGGAISGNALAISPTLEADLWDAPAAAFTSGIYHWAKYGNNVVENDANTLKITFVDNEAGAYEFFKDAADLSSDLTVDKWYSFSVDAKVNAGSNLQIYVYDGSNSYMAGICTETDFTRKTKTFRAFSTSGAYVKFTNMGTGEIIWFDNLSLQPLTLSTLFSSLQLSSANTVVDCEVSARTDYTQVGAVARLDSAVTPANFIIAYFNGDGYVKCDECVAGAYANLLTVAKAWTTGDHLILSLNGSLLRLYHVTAAGVAVLLGVATTNVTTGNLAGAFSTYTANRINSLVVWPKGNENQYSFLDTLIN